MTAHLTEAEARRLGITAKPARKRTTRKALPRAGTTSRCVACGTTFTTIAAEDRHVAETMHARYESDVCGQPVSGTMGAPTAEAPR